MDGVTILQTIAHVPYIPLIIIGIIILGAAISILIVSWYIDDYSNILIPEILFWIFGIFCIGIGMSGYNTPAYKVTLSDTVSYNEFTAKYDIVKTEGKILTVRLKDTLKENNKTNESKEDE